MKTDSLLPFESIPYFTIDGFKQAAGIESPHAARVQLHRWARSGHILSLKRGVYMSRRFFDQHEQIAIRKQKLHDKQARHAEPLERHADAVPAGCGD